MSSSFQVLNLDLLTGHKSINESKETYASLSQLSLSGASNSLAASNISHPTSFLDGM